MNNRIGWISLIISILAIGTTVSIEVWNSTHHKYGFIMLKKVFDDFEMSKQYKKKMESVQMARKGIIDSLELNLNVQLRAIKSGKEKSPDKIEQFQADKQYFMERRKQINDDNDAMIRQYNEEIIKQMNQYIKDYGEKHGYEMLFGAEGSGTLMYGNPAKDITEDIIKYINERYKGNNK